MEKKDMQILVEQYYKFVGIPKRTQNKILNTLREINIKSIVIYRRKCKSNHFINKRIKMM